MIFATSISQAKYQMALQDFRRTFPEKAWGLTFHPEGDPWYFPDIDAYCCLKRLHKGRVEVTGVFRASGAGGAHVATAVVDLCRTLWYKGIELDCFSTVEHVWIGAGFSVVDTKKFNKVFAPTLWRPEFGTPDVVYLFQYIGD